MPKPGQKIKRKVSKRLPIYNRLITVDQNDLLGRLNQIEEHTWVLFSQAKKIWEQIHQLRFQFTENTVQPEEIPF